MINKAFLLIVVLVNVTSLLFSQEIKLATNDDFYITPQNDSVFIKTFIITNKSRENFWIWFDTAKSQNNLNNIKRYFYPAKGEISLLEILNDESVSNKRLNILGQTFLKMIKPGNHFRICIIANHSVNLPDEKLRNRIIIAKSSELPQTLKEPLRRNAEYTFSSDVFLVFGKDFLNF